MGTTAQTIIDIAKAEVGYHEGRTGGHWNNDEKYAAQVPGLEWANHQAWCATFNCYLDHEAGLTPGVDFPLTASCDVAAAWFKAHGRWSEYPALGAWVLFGTPADLSHTGRVVAFDADTITVIAGNSNDNGSREGDGVYVRVYQRRSAYVVGYGYPRFPEGIVSADPARQHHDAPHTPTTPPTPAPPVPPTSGLVGPTVAGPWRIVTQNVCALPVMTQQAVLADIDLTTTQADIVLWQEIVPARYRTAVEHAAGGWAHYTGSFQNTTPISWRTALFELVESGERLLNQAVPGICGRRYITWVKLRCRKSGVLVVVHNTHYIPGGWSLKPTVRRAERRAERRADWATWNRIHRALVEGWVKAGLLVVGGGDYNRRLLAGKPFGTWVAGRWVRYAVPVTSIDCLSVISNATHRFQVLGTATLGGRHSDHKGRRVTVNVVQRRHPH